MQMSIADTLLRQSSLRRTALVDLGLILSGALLVALMAQLRMYLPGNPVPVTGQTLAVLLVGMALGSRRGGASLLVYLASGLLGLPFTAGSIFGPTGGYLIGFAAAAAVVGWLAERGFDRSPVRVLFAFAAGTGIIYLCGAVILSAWMGWEKALLVGVLPFMAGDALKAVIAAGLLPAARKYVAGLESGS